jgi:fatty-acyl-CoA synthase
LQTSFDTNHNIRVAIGNGLRKDIWTEFQNRYQIKDIVEFYSSTDIPIGFVNIYEKPENIFALAICQI